MRSGFVTLILSLVLTWIGAGFVKIIEVISSTGLSEIGVGGLTPMILSLPVSEWPIFLASAISAMVFWGLVAHTIEALREAILICTLMGRNRSSEGQSLVYQCHRLRFMLFASPLYGSLLAGAAFQIGVWLDEASVLSGIGFPRSWLGFIISVGITFLTISRVMRRTVSLEKEIEEVLPPEDVKRFLGSLDQSR